eukprot:COSAG01_NODE_15545_length_1324_cov_72.912653_1_plen_430_part_01
MRESLEVVSRWTDAVCAVVITDVWTAQVSLAGLVPSINAEYAMTIRRMTALWIATVYGGGGTAVDGCGVCGASGELCYDCADVPFGDNYVDQCGVCDDSAATDCALDCLGVWGGGLEIDQCAVCGGDNSSCVDCSGTPYGNRSADRCGVCDDNSHNDCSADCASVWGGNLTVDGCGVCGGNESSCIGCDGVLYSRKQVDRCGICGGRNVCVGCDGVPRSGLLNDTCGTCGGTIVPSDFFSSAAILRQIGFDSIEGPISNVSTFEACARECLNAGAQCKAVVGAVTQAESFQACFLGMQNTSSRRGTSTTSGFVNYLRLTDPSPHVPASCPGCDGMPLSGLVRDSCGVCDGDDQCVATAQATLNIDIATIPLGSSERASFEVGFLTEMASSLGIDRQRIRIVGIATGSVVITFDVLPALNATALSPRALLV